MSKLTPSDHLITDLSKLFEQRSLRYFERIAPIGNSTKMPENRYREMASWIVKTCKESEVNSEAYHTWKTMLAIIVGKEVEGFFIK